MPKPSAAEKRRAKLDQLVESEGYETLDDLLQAVITDSVPPAICMNDGCDYTESGGDCAKRSHAHLSGNPVRDED